MKTIWKNIFFILVIVCICGNVSFASMAQETSENDTVSTYAIDDREQLKTEIYEALINKQSMLGIGSYYVSTKDKEELMALYSEVLSENPELFYVKPNLVWGFMQSQIIQLVFSYEDYTDEEKLVLAEVIEQVTKNVDDEMTDVEKALFLHDYLAQNCTYVDKESLGDTVSENEKLNSTYSALVERRADSEGYALAYSVLLRRVGITGYLCISQQMNRTWNFVLIDGEWYHVDVASDDPACHIEGRTEHNYFLLSDTEMANRGHYGWGSYQNCNSTIYDYPDYWWGYVNSQIYVGNSMYYIERWDRGFQLIEKIDLCTYSRYVNDCCWEVWNGDGTFWEGAFTYLSSQGNYLYFNDKLNLYAMNVAGGTPQVIYTYDGGDGYIYGAMVYADGTARLNIAQKPNTEFDGYITINLKADAPVLVVDYEAGTISTTAAMAYSTDGGSTWKACTDNMQLTAFGWNGLKSKTVSFKVSEEGGRFESDITEVVLNAIPGITVGQLKSFGDEGDSIIIKLYDSNGTEVTTITVNGDSSEYTLGSVNEGTYTMSVSKTNHVTREYTVTIGDEALTQDVELHLVGDITGDGVINARDKKTMFNHISGSSKLNGYDFKVADVNGDGVINARDKKMLFNHISGSSGLWK